MVLNLTNYPLERFMIWLTGNDKNLSVVVDDPIAVAIKIADPNETMAHVEGNIVWWSETWELKRYDNLTRVELLDLMTDAMSKGQFSKVKAIQNKLGI